MFFSVDVMGACGSIKCERGDGLDSCSAAVEEEYKFYLSFENAICKDYVTEKLFVCMNRSLVPVVMGSGPYNNGVSPPHSVINIADFDSPKELAEYLLWLDKNPKEYLSYFWWHDYYEIQSRKMMRIQAACEICRKLHTETEKSTENNLYDWWVEDANCMTWFSKPLLSV